MIFMQTYTVRPWKGTVIIYRERPKHYGWRTLGSSRAYYAGKARQRRVTWYANKTKTR